MKGVLPRDARLAESIAARAVLRDLLLPRLMNGEGDVVDPESANDIILV
jgi:hypothetical protein